MKPPRQIWRNTGWLLFLATAGVVIADNIWLRSWDFSLRKSADWLFVLDSSPPTAVQAPVVANPEGSRSPGLSMTQLLNGLLFSPPGHGGGWRLDSAPAKSSLGWLTQQDREIFTASSNYEYPSSQLRPSEFVGYSPALVAVPNDPNGGPTTTGTWISNASGNWGTPTNWQGGTIPNGNTARARFDLLNITTDVTVTNEVPRTIGFVDMGDTNGTNHYNITGSAITFANTFDGVATLQQTATSAGDTISAPMLLTDNLRVRNFSANALTLSGTITANAPAPSSATISFEQGTVNITGNMSNGSGTALGVQVNGGLVTISGTNSYTRQTFVNAGTLLINGNNSAATGPVVVTGEGTLGGTGTIGGEVEMFGNSRITGGTTTTVGTLTMLDNVFMVDGESGGGTYIANLLGSTSDLLAITGNLTLGFGSFLTISGTADGTTTYVLATFASVSDVFDSITGLPANYKLVYNATDIELVPIPEPATWIGGVLALGAVALTRKKLKR